MANSTNTFKRRLDIYIDKTRILSTIFVHSYREPEVVMTYFDMTKSYPDRLRKLKLPTLTYRRARGDMIETYIQVIVG